jgi:hypothetical protein
MGINSSQPPGGLGTADPAYPANIMMFATFTGPIMVLMITVTIARLAYRCFPQYRLGDAANVLFDSTRQKHQVIAST